MTPLRARHLGIASLLTLVLLAAAAPARAQDGAAGDEFILPYVTDGTLIVARLETAKADLKPIEELIIKAMNDSMPAAGVNPQVVAQFTASTQEGMKRARQWLDDMAKAGGSRIYVVVDVSDFSDAGPLVVVPTGPGAKAGQIASLLNTGKPDAAAEEDAKAKQARQNLGQADPFGGGRQRATELGKAVVYGTPGQVDRVRKQVEAGVPGAAARREVLDALKAAGGDDVVGRMALVPGEAARQWVETNLPALPPQVGGGETRLLSRGVSWAALGVRQKPDMKGSVIVQTKDADTAKALVEKMNKGKEFVHQQMQGAPPQVATTWGKQLEELKPQTQGERITMALTPDMLAMPFFAARGAAVQAGPAPTAPPAANDKGGL